MKHGGERGFTVHEVENQLKKFLCINRCPKLSWDDVIDMFIIRKFE
jgi:hypothetical protein